MSRLSRRQHMRVGQYSKASYCVSKYTIEVWSETGGIQCVCGNTNNDLFTHTKLPDPPNINDESNYGNTYVFTCDVCGFQGGHTCHNNPCISYMRFNKDVQEHKDKKLKPA